MYFYWLNLMHKSSYFEFCRIHICISEIMWMQHCSEASRSSYWKWWKQGETLMASVSCSTRPSGLCPYNLINGWPSRSWCAGLSDFFIKSMSHQHSVLFFWRDWVDLHKNAIFNKMHSCFSSQFKNCDKQKVGIDNTVMKSERNIQ